MEKNSPQGRYGDPLEFAHFVKSVIENEYINGVALRIDGAMKLPHI